MIYDVIILGAGVAGLTCGGKLANHGLKIAIIEKNEKAGKKLLITGGGKCNFANKNMGREYFLSDNPHFCRSALSKYKVSDLLKEFHDYDIPFEEREYGQLFCERSAGDFLDMLMDKCKHVDFKYNIDTESISREEEFFTLKTNRGEYYGKNLLIATGGPAWQQVGGTDDGARLAKQFGHEVIHFSPGLVPLSVSDGEIRSLSGISLPVVMTCGDIKFELPLLFTHSGISGPATLQISNYWKIGDTITIDFLPYDDIFQHLHAPQNSKAQVGTVLSYILPSRLVKTIVPEEILLQRCNSATRESKKELDTLLHAYELVPSGTEGLKKSEISMGGVSTAKILSKSMESQLIPQLYFAGEVMDVTGQLGGYNIFWAYASARAVADDIISKNS